MYTYSKIYILDGLDCAVCAEKINKAVGKLNFVSKTEVNFIGKELRVEILKTFNEKDAHNEIQKLINSVENGIKVRDKSDKALNEPDSEQSIALRKNILQIITGAVILALAVFLPITDYVELCLFILSYTILGFDVVKSAVKNILKGNAMDENFLMTIATIGAFCIREYPEAVAVMLFYKIGELFQEIAVNNSRKSISSLVKIKAEYANVKRNGQIVKLPAENIAVDETIIIKSGEQVPMDAVIIKGTTAMDTSALTGESMPREVNVGDEIYSGFINTTAVIEAKVIKTAENSTAAKILKLVENSYSKKAKSEQFVTKFAKYYTPCVVIFAVLLAVIVPVVLSQPFSQWLNRALVFLVVSCPCALVISIPLSFFGGIGGLSKKGVLVKGGNYLEALNSVGAVVFDKTGTLTKAAFEVSEVNTFAISNEELIKYIAYAESYSNHPIAKVIVKEYSQPIDSKEISNYKEIAGKGISAVIFGRSVLAGNKSLMDENGVESSDVKGTTIHLAIDGSYMGYVVLKDAMKEESKKTVSGLKRLGIKRIVMLSGDDKATCGEVAEKLGIGEVYSNLLPAGKVNQLEMISETLYPHEKIIFVGDGINDAPVLARADIAVAMGCFGSDSAIQASDIVLMNDNPSALLSAFEAAKKTRRVVTQNIVLALAVKGVVLALGAIGIATMWEAVVSDVGVSMLAVLNAMRLLKVKS